MAVDNHGHICKFQKTVWESEKYSHLCRVLSRHVLQLYAITSIPNWTIRPASLAQMAYPKYIHGKLTTRHNYDIMRLKVQITEYKGGRKSFLVFDDIHKENSDIRGEGWALCDAISDFIGQYNRSAFFDDDTPVLLRLEDIELKKIKILVRKV